MTRDFDLASYDYDLPPDLIAQTPIEPRDASRLMQIDRAANAISHHSTRDLPTLLRPGDLLVVNRTRVIPARVRGHRLPGGGATEILLLRRIDDAAWETLARPGKRLAIGTRVGFGDREVYAEIVDRTPAGGRVVRFICEDGSPVSRARFDDWIARVGETPLPPYIRERLDDPERYQTVFATDPGSAAAPTAGLHFTPELLFRLRDRGIHIARVRLNIGLDTFRPVEADDIRAHAIHSEEFEVPEETAAAIGRAKSGGRRVIAVGTTVARTLESSRGEAARGDTRLFIYPGHQFAVIDALITNFHMPKSSLLMLASAFAGRELIGRAYATAIAEQYRFFSFGDAMLIE
ncbi:MAG: tRNA preQ1(34) S-adenosylmethionine ribosyltransferase-isomerase QueA [Chloroflexota bacterium]|nr:MAG: tRNA preQ1(34) S-adenosylmethionine ribosyltransferase-isomerase QueA [Chloroflexota bacterium]